MFFWKYACQMIFEGNNKQAPWGLLCASGLGIISKWLCVVPHGRNYFLFVV